MLSLSATRLCLEGGDLRSESAGPLSERVHRHLQGDGPTGLLILGRFGSGKTSLCNGVAANPPGGSPPCSVVPLRSVARCESIEAGLRRSLGDARLAEAQRGDRILLLDGLDEVARPGEGSYPAFFEELITLVGPRWVMTSRPDHFRTDVGEAHADQVDVLERSNIELITIDPLPLKLVRQIVGELPGGHHLLRTVEGLEQLATSPILLNVVHAALPFIEPGRPIHPWGLFDAWIRRALDTGPGHTDALQRLEELAWRAFRDQGFSVEGASFSADAVAKLEVPASLRSSLLVSDLDGRLRFGHRSVYEFLVASHLVPRLAANQGHGPDDLTGLLLSDAMRAFTVGRVAHPPLQQRSGRVRIPRGNFIAGGDASSDERPLRIAHVAEPFWIARAPVTNADWAAYLQEHPDNRVDANYLRHWGTSRTLPEGREAEPVMHLWPEDADLYAERSGARLPTADEWEKAVRGIDGRRWPWGDHYRAGGAVTGELGLRTPLPARAWGAVGWSDLFSAVGNVFEYTSSDYRDRPGRGRIVMGGCYTHPAPVSRPSLRLSHTLSGSLKAGCRLAWDDA